MKKVLIINPLLKQYHLSFIEKLYHALQQDNIQLKLVYAEPSRKEQQKSDNVEIAAGIGTKTRMSWFLNSSLAYQHVFKDIIESDLIIIEHSYKYIVTYLNLALSMTGLKKVAFWGHGRNRQAMNIGFTEWLKMHTVNGVDWWFAYTGGVAAYLMDKGVPPGKITIVQNTVNIEAFRKELSGVTESDMSRVRQQFAIPAHAVIGLYCGSLYPDKHLPFLLQSATLIKEAIPGFELVIVGDGEQKALIQDAAQNLPWVHYAGPQFGYEKAVYFKMALLFLHPGATGLAILDSFAAGLPMITTDIPFHGPEIDYLENGVNGLILPFDRRSYADGIIALLADKERLAAIRECAAASAEKYTLDAMVNNFRAGILKCLEL